MRYTGPKMKLCRKEGINLFGSEKYDLSTSHRKLSKGGRFGKASDFSVQLRKKQIAKRMYGLSERQFTLCFQRAVKTKGVTGDEMLRLLETRLDSVVYRSNFARTMMQARQFVNHGHFQVNGKKVDIPSYTVKVGDVISLREKMKESSLYKTLAQEFVEFIQKNTSGTVTAVRWLGIDTNKLSITVKSLPEKEDFDQSIDIQKIVEFYSK